MKKTTSTILHFFQVLNSLLKFGTPPATLKMSFPALFPSCYSTGVGRIGGKQGVALGFGCFGHGRAVHEIGHAIGKRERVFVGEKVNKEKPIRLG